MCAKAKVYIKAKSRLNYADSCAGQSVISSLAVENTGDAPLRNVRLVVSSENGELAQTSFEFDKIKPKEKISRAAASVRPSARVMQKVTNEYTSTIHAELFDGADVIGSTSCEIAIDPVDMWAGYAATPALAGFCITNHPVLGPLCKRTSDLLKERYGSGSLSGYKNADPAWPAKMAKAAYDALNEQKLTYALPPDSFICGQRIRLVNRVLTEGQGTCICLAFTFASLIAALRLDPIVCMYDNHAFAGVWVKKPSADAKHNAFNRNKVDLASLSAGSDPSIMLVECTMLTHDGKVSFEDAKKSALDQLKNKPNFEYWLDIHEARLRGGLPMPLFVEDEDEEGADGADGAGAGAGGTSVNAGGSGSGNAGGGGSGGAGANADGDEDDLPFGPKPDEDQAGEGESDGTGASGGDQAGEGESDAAGGGGADGDSDDAGDDGAGDDGSSGGSSARPSRKPRKPAKDEVIEDLRAHVGELGFSPITRALMGEALPDAHRELEEPAVIDPTGMVAPLPSDASQLFAVQYVSSGGSCVIDGSPGTGKTQVIVNAAIDGVAHGKKVLIVLQNEEQLGVMEKRLHAAAAQPFVLRVDKDAKSASLLQQIEDATTMDASRVDELLASCGFSRLAEAADVQRSVELSRELDSYGAALQRENAAGISLREQIEGYQRYRNAPDLVHLGKEAVTSLSSRRDLDESLRLIDDACAHAAEMGAISQHPLARFGGALKDQTAYELRSFAEEGLAQVGALREALAALSFGGAFAPDSDPVPALEPDGALGLMEDLADFADRTWADEAAGRAVCAALAEPLEQLCLARDFASQMEGLWKPSFFELDAEELGNRWRSACSCPLVRRRAAKREVLAQIEEHAWKPLVEADAENALSALTFYKGQINEAAMGFAAQAAHIEAQLAIEHEALSLLAQIDDELHKWNVWMDYADAARARGLGKMVDALQAGAGALQLGVSGGVPQAGADPQADGSVNALQSADHAAQVAQSAKKSLFHAMCADSIRSDETVRRFSGPAFERVVKRFSDIDEARRARAARTLVETCAARAKETLSNEDLAKQVEAYKVALQAHGRGSSVASLLRAFPDVALGACPCVLATPLSVARHLDWGIKFDLLIMDEASQLETGRAVGLFERAAQAVVVGDPQQLPPTNFFTKKQDVSDLGIVSKGESILDECLIMGLPRITLRWHYRSRHESLIAFSNEQFYRGRLLTFPSADDRASKVCLHRVQGVYEKGGTNPAEAEAIVAEIKRRYEADLEQAEAQAALGNAADQGGEGERKASGCGIGVITFNVKQQALVQKLLMEEFSRDAAFAAWAQEGSECLFVRNLENVQGDERDVIMLSMTYARDAEGKLSLNFGPVNKAGGERRLNVAFTRARCEMLVFATLTSGEIDLGSALARGVCVVRDFLAYAEGLRGASSSAVGGAQAAASSAIEADAIADRLCQALEERGYVTQRSVGASQVKVDIAVVDPKDSRRYLAGILLDGSSYRVARSTRDRELGKQEQLRDLGWNVHRVWAVDYLFDESKCVERALSFLGDLAA